MGRAFYWPLALLFLANVIPSKAQNAEADSAGAVETRLSVAAGEPLALECRLRPEQRTEWRRDGGELPADLRVEPEQPAPDGRLAARLRAAAARPRHAGLYTCSRERDQRVRLLVHAAAAAPAGAAGAGAEAGATTEAARAAAGGGGAPDRLFDVRGNITLRCTLPNDKTQEYIWKKNDTLVTDLWDLKDRYKLEHGSAEFKIERSQEDDFGNYSCSLPGAADEQRWVLRGRPHVKLPANSNVVEGQKLKLVCKMVGKPYQRVTWQFSNSTEDNFTDVEEALGGRAELAANEQGVPGAALVLAAAARADAGSYRCSAPDAALPAVTVLRVKDMYAALWPFLGICAEVFVLCAIILVYEKRRTKPELDDSDTDNHDQKKS